MADDLFKRLGLTPDQIKRIESGEIRRAAMHAAMLAALGRKEAK